MTPQEKIIFDRVNMLAARIFNDPSHVLMGQFRRVMTEYFLETYHEDVPFVPAPDAPPPEGEGPRPERAHPGPRIGRPKMGLDPDR